MSRKAVYIISRLYFPTNVPPVMSFSARDLPHSRPHRRRVREVPYGGREESSGGESAKTFCERTMGFGWRGNWRANTLPQHRLVSALDGLKETAAYEIGITHFLLAICAGLP